MNRTLASARVLLVLLPLSLSGLLHVTPSFITLLCATLLTAPHRQSHEQNHKHDRDRDHDHYDSRVNREYD